MTETNLEIQFVKSLIAGYPRTGGQLNEPFLSDAEVVRMKDGVAVVSIDTVSEEYQLGLLRDPESLGWLTVTASLSDLAACGVVAQAVSLHLGAPPSLRPDEKWIEAFKKGGVDAAKIACGARVTEFKVFESPKLISSATALRVQKEPPPLSRKRFSPGSSIYLTGPVGWGNAVAFANVAVRAQAPELADQLDRGYRPLARSREAELVGRFAEACIDTSDGLLFTLDLLMELERSIGFRLEWSADLLHPVARKVAELARVPKWIFAAGQNGEFELLFSVPKQNEASFASAAQALGFKFLRVGSVSAEPALELAQRGQAKRLDLSPVRNLLHGEISPEKYVRALIEMAVRQGIE